MTTTLPVRLRFTTANIAGNLNDAQARSDYNAVAARSDIFCTQEMQRRDARHFVDQNTWETVQDWKPGGNSTARVALHFRRNRFTEQARANVLLHVSHLFPSATRHMEWVRLKDNWTGRYFTVVGVHMIPHADDEVGGLTHFPRRKLVLTAITVLLALVRSTTFGQLVVLGDFNTDLRRDLEHDDGKGLVEQFKSAGLVSSAEVLGVPRGTHGPNVYDQIYFRRPNKKAYHLLTQTMQAKRNSDHRAYTVEVLVTQRRQK